MQQVVTFRCWACSGVVQAFKKAGVTWDLITCPCEPTRPAAYVIEWTEAGPSVSPCNFDPARTKDSQQLQAHPLASWSVPTGKVWQLAPGTTLQVQLRTGNESPEQMRADYRRYRRTIAGRWWQRACGAMKRAYKSALWATVRGTCRLIYGE